MLALFLFILFGVIFGYFATLNTTPITISFGKKTPMVLIRNISIARAFR